MNPPIVRLRRLADVNKEADGILGLRFMPNIPGQRIRQRRNELGQQEFWFLPP
jgi:hypothetical protein